MTLISYTAQEIHQLKTKAVQIRKHIIEMLYQAQSGHPGGSLSAVEAIVALYFHQMSCCKNTIDDPNRDRFILSKGHAAPTLYATMAECGFFNTTELTKLRNINCMLQGHPVCTRTPGIEASTGSLGQGLSFGIGVALAGKLDQRPYRTYVMLGDGETNEGQVWEAAAAASHYHLDNLTGLLDRNFLQIDGKTEDVLRIESVHDRWHSFGWHVIEINGHDFPQILDALDEAQKQQNQPTMIILNTIKGKDISFMENNVDFHGVPPNKLEYQRALEELENIHRKLEAEP